MNNSISRYLNRRYKSHRVDSKSSRPTDQDLKVPFLRHWIFWFLPPAGPPFVRASRQCKITRPTKTDRQQIIASRSDPQSYLYRCNGMVAKECVRNVVCMINENILSLAITLIASASAGVVSDRETATQTLTFSVLRFNKHTYMRR